MKRLAESPHWSKEVSQSHAVKSGQRYTSDTSLNAWHSLIICRPRTSRLFITAPALYLIRFRALFCLEGVILFRVIHDEGQPSFFWSSLPVGAGSDLGTYSWPGEIQP